LDSNIVRWSTVELWMRDVNPMQLKGRPAEKKAPNNVGADVIMRSSRQALVA